ncbi:hypothetical protein AB0M05_47575 [Streptomyces violaceusniger]|uniref:hypothetical protein n=1 Tax=Streptomyces violaceusniger TaxID=68280 RepID=UPI00341C4220
MPPPLRRKPSAIDLAVLASHGQFAASPAPPPPNGSERSFVFSSPGSQITATPHIDQAGQAGWDVWALQKTKNGLMWVQQHQPEFTTGVKTLASALLVTGLAVKAWDGGDSVKAAEWAQAAANVLTTGTAISDVGRYLHSGITNFLTDPKESAYDLSKAAVQGAAIGVGIPTNLTPLFKAQAQDVLNIGTAIANAAGYYATGPTATEKIRGRREKDLGRSHSNRHIPSGQASSGGSQHELQSLESSGGAPFEITEEEKPYAQWYADQHPQSREHAPYVVNDHQSYGRLKWVAEEYAKRVDAQASSGSNDSNTANYSDTPYTHHAQASDQSYQQPPARLSERQRGKLPKYW